MSARAFVRQLDQPRLPRAAVDTPSRPPLAVRLTPPTTPSQALALQRAAGNAAVTSLLRINGSVPTVSRCGPTNPDCGCAEELEVPADVGVARHAVQRDDVFDAFTKTKPGDPFGSLGMPGQPDRLRFAERSFIDDSLPTVCPRCHRDNPTVPLLPRYVDQDATEPRLVAWATESEKALHHVFTTRILQLDPNGIDTVVEDYGVGLTKRISSSHEFKGPDPAREQGAETLRRRWGDIRAPVKAKLQAWHQEQLLTAVGLTPQGASPVLKPQHLKAVLASNERKTAPLGRLNSYAKAGDRWGGFVIDDINDFTVYFHLPDRPVWRYEIGKTAFVKHDLFVAEVSRQVYDSTRWILIVTPYLIKAGAFGLGFAGGVAWIITGIVLDELAEEMLRDAKGQPGRTPEEILKSAGTQFLIDRLFHGLLGGAGKVARPAGIASNLVGKVERIADRAVPLVRKELVEAEKPLVKDALERGTARRITDKGLQAEGHALEVTVESAGQSHIFRLGKDGTWCRFSTPICGLDLGSDIAAAATSPKSITAGQLEGARDQLKTITDEIEFLATMDKRMKAAGKVDVTLLSKEERALLDSLAEEGDASKLTRRELHDMATSAELTRHLRAAEAAEARLVQQLYREGRPLYDILRPASPSFKSRNFTRRESLGLDAVTGRAPRSTKLEVDHVVPLNDIMRMPGFKELRPDRQLEIVNDVKNLRTIDGLANSSRGDRSWHDWAQSLIHYDLPAILRMRALEDELRTYVAGRISALSRP